MIRKGFIAFWAPAYSHKQAAPLKIPPDAVCHYWGARLASQRCPILPNSSDIVPTLAPAESNPFSYTVQNAVPSSPSTVLLTPATPSDNDSLTVTAAGAADVDNDAKRRTLPMS